MLGRGFPDGFPADPPVPKERHVLQVLRLAVDAMHVLSDDEKDFTRTRMVSLHEFAHRGGTPAATRPSADEGMNDCHRS